MKLCNNSTICISLIKYERKWVLGITAIYTIIKDSYSFSNSSDTSPNISLDS